MSVIKCGPMSLRQVDIFVRLALRFNYSPIEGELEDLTRALDSSGAQTKAYIFLFNNNIKWFLEPLAILIEADQVFTQMEMAKHIINGIHNY